MTYHDEMKAKYPDRPWISRPTWELSNMKRALSMFTWNNTDEETQRLTEVTRELKLRRSNKARVAVAIIALLSYSEMTLQTPSPTRAPVCIEYCQGGN